MPDRRDAAIGAGYTVVDPTTALATHLSELIRTLLAIGLALIGALSRRQPRRSGRSGLTRA